MANPSSLEELTSLSHAVIGAAIEVHRALGPGFLESSYERALSIELRHRNIPHLTQVPVALAYRGETIGDGRLDMLVADQLVVELKAVETLHSVHKAQVLSYLKATGLRLGLLINFNTAILKDGIERVIHD